MPEHNESEHNGSEQDVLLDDGLIQGGTISGLDQVAEWRPEKHHAVTASQLARWLLILLGGSFVAHYIAITALSLCGKTQAVDVLSSLFDKWLPVMAGFVGGAVTYYFTRDQRAK